MTYPYVNDAGQTVWACCESRIGPTCGHQNGLDNQGPSWEERREDD
jgi:hypothetical protein